MYMPYLQCEIKTVSMLKIKTLKHCENSLKVSNEIKEYTKNTIVRSH